MPDQSSQRCRDFAKIPVMGADEFPDNLPQSLPGTVVLRRMPGEFAPDGVTPMYALSDGAPRAVPTGRVLVRFEESMRFEDQAASFISEGFTVDQPLSYAPHAGWVRALSGSAADALRNFDRLARLSGVRHVEPQLLYERAFR